MTQLDNYKGVKTQEAKFTLISFKYKTGNAKQKTDDYSFCYYSSFISVLYGQVFIFLNSLALIIYLNVSGTKEISYQRSATNFFFFFFGHMRGNLVQWLFFMVANEEVANF